MCHILKTVYGAAACGAGSGGENMWGKTFGIWKNGEVKRENSENKGGRVEEKGSFVYPKKKQKKRGKCKKGGILP